MKFTDIKFQLVPVKEIDKPLNGADEFMRLNILSEENIGRKKLPLKTVVDILCGLQPKVPIWINVLFIKLEDNSAIFELQFSLRFRKPTLLRNVETGHAQDYKR